MDDHYITFKVTMAGMNKTNYFILQSIYTSHQVTPDSISILLSNRFFWDNKQCILVTEKVGEGKWDNRQLVI